MERRLDAGRDYGIETVQGFVLAENTQILKLGRELGFQISKNGGGNTYHLTTDL